MIRRLRTQYQEEMRIFQHNHERAREEMEDIVENTAAACTRPRAQIEAVKADRMSLRVQCFKLNQDCAFLESQIGNLRIEVD